MEAFEALRPKECVLEQRIDLERENSRCSGSVAKMGRSRLPVAENVHINGIFAFNHRPHDARRKTQQTAIEMASKIACGLNYLVDGRLKFFVSRQGEINC